VTGIRAAWSLLAAATLLVAGAAPSNVSLDAARADAARGDHRAALQKIAALLAPSNDPQPADRYELLMIKAESQLQLKDRLGSVSSFRSAAKAAGEVGQLAAARANALIIERSSAGQYKPALAIGEAPIDVVSPESRKTAMARLQQELWTKNARDVEQAMRADTLPPIERVFTTVADAYCLEVAATGDARQTGPAMRELGGRAFRLMGDEISRCARVVDQMSQLANSAQGYDYAGWTTYARGLLPAERTQLREMTGYLSKIQGRAREYREAAARLGGEPQKWDALVAQVTDALFQAQALAEQH
jgi:hypothetical protein